MGNRQYKAKQIIKALEQADGVVVVAAKLLGCNPSTVYRYADRYSTVKDALKTSRRSLVAEAQGHLVKLMRTASHKDQYRAIMKILETYDDLTDWAERQRTELSGPDGGPVEVKPLRWADEDE